MKYIFLFSIFVIIYYFRYRKYINPYKLYMIFGKKGSGKSSFLVKKAIEYHKKGYLIYTNMIDLMLPYARIIDPSKLGDFIPPADSCLLLDEVGMLYDNRNYKNFRPAVRDFFKLQRHYKVICFLASQTFDIDKKLRDLTDEMYLVTNIGIVYSLIRPIHKTVTLTDATSEGESRIAENLRFRFLTSWKLIKVTKYVKYFQSFNAPELPGIEYLSPEVIVKEENHVRVLSRVREKLKIELPSSGSVSVGIRIKDKITSMLNRENQSPPKGEN